MRPRQTIILVQPAPMRITAMTDDLKLALRAAHKACALIKAGFEQDFTTEHKADKSLVTSVDQQVDRLIYEFDLRTWGTTALELCAVAKGSADAFICVGDKLWDYAAGMCIVKEAGGEFLDWRGAAWNSSHSFILACQPGMKGVIIENISHLQY
ncbi:hypothetical protein EH222_11175 [candidate division KSB1 bacterium]|nr:MAG: hypothetical protein EH222_11175 [candidate division KSB1 bacterium]